MSVLDDPPEERIRNVGHIIDHLEVSRKHVFLDISYRPKILKAAIVDKEGKILKRGERGDLLVRGYSVMYGYWDNEDQTRAEITRDRWYHTG
jgi:long-subunit acyl-CoA synthetase (AMP-forming)